MPWMTQWLLVSMHARDKFYKQLKLKKVTRRKMMTQLHKRYRNIIVNLLPVSKQNYDIFKQIKVMRLSTLRPNSILAGFQMKEQWWFPAFDESRMKLSQLILNTLRMHFKHGKS